MSAKKPRMNTEIEVYNRIKWDSDFNPNEWEIGYEDFGKIIFVPFNHFVTMTECIDEGIPMHRIKIFKQNGVEMWNRIEKFDKVFKSR